MLAAVLVLVGVGVFSYPLVADWLADRNHASVVGSYAGAVSRLDGSKREAILAEAQEYNENLAGDPVHDPFVPGSGYALPDNYLDVLNPDGDGVMGYLTIKKINLRLPIYHGSDESVLAKGVGHMRQTALPIGGKGTRSVLTGHRGLPSAELFTRLDELTEGDVFTISVLDETLAYKVVNIETVTPDALEELRAYQDRDLVTLVTCTPYGVNTHRLLVTGERTTYVPDDDTGPAGTFLPAAGSSRWLQWVSTLTTVGLLVLVAGLTALIRRRRRHRHALPVALAGHDDGDAAGNSAAAGGGRLAVGRGRGDAVGGNASAAGRDSGGGCDDDVAAGIGGDELSGRESKESGETRPSTSSRADSWQNGAGRHPQ